jgi:hypothetical protein
VITVDHAALPRLQERMGRRLYAEIDTELAGLTEQVQTLTPV